MAYIDDNPRKGVSHFSIFDYWKDKVILENGEIVEIKDRPTEKYERVVYDWGEPCCWACDKPIITTYERDKVREADFQKIWNDTKVKKHLNRCHVVPRTKGGEDSPSNMFLMCNSCHEMSPDTVNTRTFFRWVYDQRKTHCYGIPRLNILYDKILKILDRRGLNITPEDIVKIVGEDKFTYDSLKEYLSSHIETHEFHYSETTMLEGFVDYLMSKYIDKVLEV